MNSTSSLTFVFLVFVVAASTCYATQYLPCKDKTLTAKINKVTVTPCSELPCQLEKGTNVTVDVGFTMEKQSKATKATTVVHGLIDGVEVPYPTDYTDACKTAGLKCPLNPSSYNIYHAQLYIRKLYPDIKLYVQWELQNEKDKDIFCFLIPVIIEG